MEATEQSSSRRSRALLALLLLVPVPSLGVAAAMLIEATQGTPVGQGLYLAAKAWILAFPVAWLLLVERGRLSLSPPSKGGFGVAAALGVAIAALILLVYWGFGSAWIDAERVREAAVENGIAEPATYIGLALYLTFVNSLLEEYVWRWFVFRRCETLLPQWGGWLAVGVSAVLFTVHHVLAMAAQFPIGVTVLGSIGVFIGGAAWSWCYFRYRSIWPGYVSHLIVDAAIFSIGWMLIFD